MAEEFGNDDFVVPTLPEFGQDDAVVNTPNDVVASVARGGTATPAEFQTRQRLIQLRDELDAEIAAPKYRVGVQLPFMDEPIVSAPIPASVAAFGAEATKNVLPTGAGLAAASAVTPYTNAAANVASAIPGVGRVASPVIRYGGPLLAGAIAGGTTRVVEDAALPQILFDDAAQSYELTQQLAGENPEAAMLGQFAGAGPFFRPGLPVGTTGTARLATPLIAGGIGGGIEGAQQLAAGEYDPVRLGTAIAGSALLNRETGLGRRIGPNLVLPDIAGPVPEELATMGRVLREPVLPEATTVPPAELVAVASVNAASSADIAGAAQAGSTLDELKARRLGERMMGKTPDQQLEIVKQEVKLAGDTLTPQQQRGALDLQQALEDQIQVEKNNAAAADEAQAAMEAQQKAIQEVSQLAVPEVPQVPKSTQIIEEANAPKSLANAAASSAKAAEGNLTQLQTQINETVVAPVRALEGANPVEAQSPALAQVAEVDSKPVTIKAAVKDKDTEWLYTVQRMPNGAPGFVQVDAINPLAEGVERNVVSSNPADLRKAGADIPDVPDWVPQGQYSREQVKQFIKEGQPKNETPNPTQNNQGGSLEGGQRGLSGLPEVRPISSAPAQAETQAGASRITNLSDEPIVFKKDDPTPGTRQSIEKFGQAENLRRTIEAVSNGSKPVAAITLGDIPNEILYEKNLRIAEDPLSPESGAIIFKTAAAKEKYIRSAKKLNSDFNAGEISGLEFEASLGRLLGYTEREIADFHAHVNGPRGGSPMLESDAPAKLISTAELRLNNAGIDLPPVSSLTAKQKLAELQQAGIKTYAGKPISEANPAQLSNALGKWRRGQLERGAISTQAALPLGGGTAGAVTGFVATDREPGETDDEYNARRLRNAAIGAAAGAGGGVAIGALARGAQAVERARATARRSGRVDTPATEANQGVRRTAEKVIENRQYPEALRQTLADDPDIIYNKFALSDLADRVSAATEAELVQMRGSPNIRERLGATAELANRLSLSPDTELQKQGAALYSELAQSLTDPAQLLGLGKLVKTPQGFVTALNEKLKDVQRVLSPQQEDKMRRLATESIKAEQELAVASRAAETDYTQANEAAYRAAQRKSADASKALAEFTHRVSPEGWSELLSKTIQGNLLTPLSLVANVFGNTVYQPVRRSASSFATALDAIYSATSGKPRTIARMNPLPAAGELYAAAEGIKIAGKELITGPSQDSYIKGEVQRGFRPLRSLVQSFTGEDLAVRSDGTVSLGDRGKKLYEGLVGIAPEAMFRFLSLGDKPFRRAAEVELLLEQARLKGLKGRARERFLEFPDKATQELINTEGRRAIFAQDNKFATRLNGFLDHGLAEAVGMDKVPALKAAAKVFGRLVVPFRQFPLNYVSTAMNFAAPELAMAKALAYSGALKPVLDKVGLNVTPDRRKALQNMGEAALGTMMYGAANYLWDHDLISEPTDKDAKARSVQYEQMGPQRINISGLNRAMDGGDGSYQIGDLTADWGRLGIPSAVFYVFTRNTGKERNADARTGEKRAASTTAGGFIKDRLSAFPGMASFSLDQSFLSGTSGLLEAMRNPDPEGQELQNWASNTFRAVTSIPVPNTVEALARAEFQYIPELKGDNLTETLKNTWRYKTLQISDEDRPLLKRDLWGDSISRVMQGENPYVTQFVDVTRSQRKPGDPFKQQLVDLYKATESPDVYPALPVRNVSVEGVTVKLTPADYDRYQQLVGAARLQYAKQIVANPRFVASDTIPEAKILALQEAYSEGAKVGKAQLLSLPEVQQRYPALFGQSVPVGQESRVVSRDAKARGRLRMAQPAGDFGTDDEPVP